MRILIVTARYSPHRGGLETVVQEISKHMLLQGHTVRIVTNRYPRRLPAHETLSGSAVSRFQFLYPEIPQLRAGRIDLWIAGWFYFPTTLIRLIWVIYRFKPDVVNLHYLGALGFFVLIAQKLLHFKLILSLHGGDVDGEPHQSRFNLWRFRAVSRCAIRITTCSNYLLGQMREIVSEIAPEKTRVIHNGVDAEKFFTAEHYKHPRPYVVGIGQLVSHKGFDTLLAAFAEVLKSDVGYDLLIGGDGPEREALQTQSRALGLDGRFFLLGKVDREQVAQLMCGSQAVVIPSRREPFGIVGLETMASGRPIIATRIGGLTEALNGATVTWVEPDDIANLTAALRRVKSDNSQRLLQENQRLVEASSWASVGDQYLDVYRQSVEL